MSSAEVQKIRERLSLLGVQLEESHDSNPREYVMNIVDGDSENDKRWQPDLVEIRLTDSSSCNDASVTSDSLAGCVSRRIPRGAACQLAQRTDGFSTREEFESYLGSVLERFAFDQIVAFLKSRDRSVAEARQKLMACGLDGQICERALVRAQACSLLDDRRFASTYIRSKIRAGWGKVRIVNELRRKGVSDDLVQSDDFLEPLSDESELQRATDLLRGKMRYKPLDFQKSIRFLQAKGFRFDVARSAARILTNELQEYEHPVDN